MFTETSLIEFHDLRFGLQPDEHNLIGVVRWDSDDSLKVDKEVVALIIFLKRGKTVKEAAKIIRFSPAVILTILPMLEKANFIKSVDHVLLKDNAKKIHPWLAGVSHKWFKWMVYKPLVRGILIFSTLGIVVGLLMNGLPSYKSFFWTSDLFIVFLSLYIADIPMIFLHELCHFFVTKAVGGEAVMRLSYRYIFIVAETESYHLTIVPKKQRYFVYFAGMIGDLFTSALLYSFIAVTHLFGIHIGVLENFLKAIILLEIIGIIWQFDVFLETDTYNFLSEYLGIENLRNDALKFIDLHSEKWKRILLFPIKRLLKFISEDYSENSDDLRVFSKNDRKKLFFYIFILVGGLLIITLQYVFFSIPRDITFVYQGMKDAQKGLQTSNMVLFSKSLIIIFMIVGDYLLLLYLWIKNKKKLRKRR